MSALDVSVIDDRTVCSRPEMSVANAITSETTVTPRSSPIASFNHGEHQREAANKLDVWARRDWINRFANPRIEAAYQRYVSLLWARYFLRWLVVTACTVSITPILDMLTYVADLPGATAHLFFRYALYAMAVLTWIGSIGLWFMLRCAPKTWSERLAAHRRLVLCSIAAILLLSATVPILTATSADILAAHDGVAIGYEDGRWHVTVTAVASVLLALAGLPPLTFNVVCVLAFTYCPHRAELARSLRVRLTGRFRASADRQAVDDA
jgi:hypothetical protein